MRARYRHHTACALAAVIVAFFPAGAAAQPLGTFRWQLAPFCNIVTLAVTQNAGVFEVEGTDDQCGASGTLASAIGTAFFNPDGTVGMGVNIVSAPGGAPVHLDATLTVATLGGTWRDSAGNAGGFVFTPGTGSGGNPRPASTDDIPPGSVGSAQINAAQVQRRVTDTCATGSFMRSVGEDGSVACSSEAGDIERVIAGAGLVGGGTSGSVVVGLPTTPSDAFLFDNSRGFAAVGAFGSALGPPVSGPGTRAMWYPSRAAFRAGNIVGTQWDDANIGNQSVAFGSNTTASGFHSTATGDSTIASGAQSVALGRLTTASGEHAFAMGNATSATAADAVAMGLRVTAGGNGSVVLGTDAVTTAGATGTFIFADRSTMADFTGSAANEFGVRAAGGVYLYTSSNLGTGCSLAMGSGTWACTSDRNGKEDFESVDGELVLTKLRTVPIERWSYRSEVGVRHLGPVAQDFYSAFGLGTDDKTIGHLDLSGIALRAIQALDARTQALMEENAALRLRLERLEAKQP